MTIATTKAPKQVAINDIGSAEDFLAAVEKTLKFFNDGDLIEGTVVKIDRDEVLLDVGYKTEGVIPSRELSIKHDVDPSEVVGSATPSRRSFSRRRTRKAASSCPRSARSTSARGATSRRSRKPMASSPVRSSRSSRAA